MTVSHLTDGPDQGAVTAPPTRHRLSGKLGAVALLLMVLGYNAPLAGFVGYQPVVIGYGNGLGGPLSFIFGALVLGAFAVGFMKMSSRIDHPGGFYSFITAGLGRSTGLGAAAVATVAYYSIIVSSSAFLGLSLENFVEETLGGPAIHWAFYALIALLVVGAFGYFHLEVSAKVLSLLLFLEILIVAAYDVVVVARGGSEGLAASVFDPSNFISGSVGLGLLFAATCFAGFEATVIFRHEVRDPERTIPRATYGFIVFVGLLYAFSAWAITQALGEGQAVAATAADPTGSVLGTVRTFLGVFGVDVVGVLLVTSLFASILSCHNILSRYTFNLANDGILHTRLGSVHSVQHSPHVASVAVSVLSGLGIVVCVLIQTDPHILYARLAGVFGYGFLLLIAVTCIAVVVYLNRSKPDGAGVWHRLVAPLIALAGLVAIVVLGTVNMDALLGVSKGAALLTCLGLYVVWLLGSLYARVLKSRRPQVYATIGQQ